MPQLKRWLGGGVLICSLLGAGAAVWIDRALDQPLNFASTGAAGSEYVFDVPPGSSLNAVANRLAAAGILPLPRLFSWYGELTDKAQNIQAGEYLLQMGTTPRGLMEQFVGGKVLLHSLTVIEGWTVRELLAAVAEHSALVKTLSASSAPELAAELELQFDHAEGLFLPDTYRFAKGTTDTEFLQRAHVSMNEALERVWASRAADIPITTPYEALTLASIIERETGKATERRQVAGVFARRLRDRWRLETDPTVIYGLGERFDGNLRRRDLTTDTPYNTYTRYGLPPTPIALPGIEALKAAVDPAAGEAMFFVATGQPDGSHVFSVTLAEHNRAVQSYLAALRNKTSR